MQISLVMKVSGHPFPSNLTSEESLNVDDLVDMLLVTLLKAINELGKNCRAIGSEPNLPSAVLKLLTFHSKTYTLVIKKQLL